MRGRSARAPVAIAAAVAMVAVLVALVLATTRRTSTPASPGTGTRTTEPPSAGATPGRERGRAVCGSEALRSPYSYTGAAGRYRSGTAGLPTYGAPGTDFPSARAGVVLPPGTGDYENWQLAPDTVYYLEPGTHHRSFLANAGDVFVGGFAGGAGAVLDGEYTRRVAIDSNIDSGEQKAVTIQYLTVQRFAPYVDQTAINQTGAGGWRVLNSTVTLNAPGGGLFASTDGVVRNSCLTLNGQYGFQSAAALSADALTGGPFNILIEGNEISYNDTCGLSGPLSNPSVGWKDRNPVPAEYRNAHCGTVRGTGNQGGFKLWRTNGVVIRNNWIHSNWGVGGWADTDNANTTWTGNTITDNENGAIWEETSYNFSITDNYIARNNVTDGLANPGFPMPAIYISESGSDSKNGGVPPCSMPSCLESGIPGHPAASLVEGNTLVDNGGGIFLWQNSNRNCADGYDGVCTLVAGGPASAFSMKGCAANLPGARLDRTTHVGALTGSPPANYWDGCMWQTQNVLVRRNRIDFDPAHLYGCTRRLWPACGANGVFSEYGGPNASALGPEVATQITFFQNNRWSENVYRGPSTFYAWNQGNLSNPVSWADWTGDRQKGSRCTSPDERRSGTCTGPFGQDAGSTFDPAVAGPLEGRAAPAGISASFRGSSRRTEVRQASVSTPVRSGSSRLVRFGATGSRHRQHRRIERGPAGA